MARMTAADARWCRKYGKLGTDGDRERRAKKRGKGNDWKRQEKRDRS